MQKYEGLEGGGGGGEGEGGVNKGKKKMPECRIESSDANSVKTPCPHFQQTITNQHKGLLIHSATVKN